MADDYQPLPHLLVEGEVRGVSRCSVMKNIWHQVTMNNTIRLSFLYIFVPFWIFISSISSTSNKSNDRCWCSTTPLPPRVKFRHFLLGEVQVEIQVCPLEVARDRLEVMFWGLVSISKEVSNRRSTRKNTEQTLHLLGNPYFPRGKSSRRRCPHFQRQRYFAHPSTAFSSKPSQSMLR